MLFRRFFLPLYENVSLFTPNFMITKNKIIETLNLLPDSFELEVLIERLIFIQKVEKGLLQSNLREVYSTLEAKELLKKWQK